MVICSVQFTETPSVRKGLHGFAETDSKIPNNRLAISAAMVVDQAIESDSELYIYHPSHCLIGMDPLMIRQV